MSENLLMGQFPHMCESDLDPFVRGLEVAMQLTGWKPAPLSKAAGMGETAVRDLFRKNSSPKVSTASAIARAMGLTVDYITDLGESTAEIAEMPGVSPKQRLAALYDRLSDERRAQMIGYLEYLASQEEGEDSGRREGQ